MESRHYRSVKSFMQQAGQRTPELITIPPLGVRKLRAQLILEEALETIKALGLRVTLGIDEEELHEEGIAFEDAHAVDVIEVVDGCCDIRVVTTGTLIAFGIPEEPFQTLIDDSNLAKFGPGSYRRDDGKWIKPPDWKAPDILRALQSVRSASTPTSS